MTHFVIVIKMASRGLKILKMLKENQNQEENINKYNFREKIKVR